MCCRHVTHGMFRPKGGTATCLQRSGKQAGDSRAGTQLDGRH
jgi:hypothetical protein